MSTPLQNVSRETLERLRAFESLAKKWSPRINLVSRADRDAIWERHILDSIQIYECAPTPVTRWLDLGSGGGFPGIVVAILADADDVTTQVTMIESDSRKAAFLRAALRETGVSGTVINERLESVSPNAAHVVSARALANLSSLLGMCERHLAPGGLCLLPKGATWRRELTDANRTWTFQYDVVTSKLDPNAAILKIKELSRA